MKWAPREFSRGKRVASAEISTRRPGVLGTQIRLRALRPGDPPCACFLLGYCTISVNCCVWVKLPDATVTVMV
jgi:hypothetical protein